MLKLALKSVKLFHTARVTTAAITIDKKNSRALIELPQMCIALFSDHAKNSTANFPPPPPPPLTTFITQDAEKNKAKIAEEEEEAKRKRESSWRTMKYTLAIFGISCISIGGYMILELGRPNVDDYGHELPDEFEGLPTWRQYIMRTVKELDYYKKLIREPSRDKLLPDPMQYPYLQPPYTLVLEFTDVLVHPDWTYKTGWRFKKRPGLDHLLESLHGTFEIVIYTAEQGMTVFPITDAIDPKNLISYKLVRDATHFIEGHHVKNLSKLNRDLKRVIVVDWNKESVKFHPENLLHIDRWNGTDSDITLLDLTAFLKTIAESDVDDVRDVLRFYSGFSNPLVVFRERQKKYMEQQEIDRETSFLQNSPPAQRWTPSFFKKWW